MAEYRPPLTAVAVPEEVKSMVGDSLIVSSYFATTNGDSADTSQY